MLLKQLCIDLSDKELRRFCPRPTAGPGEPRELQIEKGIHGNVIEFQMLKYIQNVAMLLMVTILVYIWITVLIYIYIYISIYIYIYIHMFIS